jgi:hypothetical protein
MPKPLRARTDADRAIDRRFEQALERAEDFFMKTGKVHRAMLELARRLDDAGIPYAIAGAMALNAHGYERVTTDVDILLTREGLARFKALNLGRGYVEIFKGSKGIRDTENDVPIDILITGEFPGDGHPKPVAFPDPAVLASEGEQFRIVPLNALLELKLASGMTAPDRLKDLADVLEVIRVLRLSESFAERLNPYVREKYLELWRASQTGGERPV